MEGTCSVCVDPVWASVNLGIMLCINCSGEYVYASVRVVTVVIGSLRVVCVLCVHCLHMSMSVHVVCGLFRLCIIILLSW